ncbi:unnamed protein product, partial [Ixodes pacificus]
WTLGPAVAWPPPPSRASRMRARHLDTGTLSRCPDGDFHLSGGSADARVTGECSPSLSLAHPYLRRPRNNAGRDVEVERLSVLVTLPGSSTAVGAPPRVQGRVHAEGPHG